MFFEQIRPGVGLCHLPDADERKLFGAGVIDKSGRTADQTDFVTRHYTLVYVLRGRAEYTDASGRVTHLHEGCYFQRIPGERHSTRIDPESRYLECFVVIGLSLYEAWREAGFLPVLPHAGFAGLSMNMADRFVALRDTISRSSARQTGDVLVRCQRLILAFLSFLRAGETRSPMEELVDAATELMDTNFTKKCDLPALCRKYGISYHSFRRRFKEWMQVSPAQYRNRRRLDHAAALLRMRYLSVSEIAYELGYSSPFEFSAAFKRCFGVAPRFFAQKD